MGERRNVPFKELVRYLGREVGRTATFTKQGEGILKTKTLGNGRRALLAVEGEGGQTYPFEELGGTPVIGHIRLVEDKIRHYLLDTDQRVFRVVSNRDNDPGGPKVEKSFLEPEEQRALLDELES